MDENIRLPDSAYNCILTEDESYDIFENRILNNEEDEDLQHVLLESRKEYLKKNNITNEKKLKLKLINELNKLIIIFESLTDNKLKEIIICKIRSYINLEIEKIVLNFDIYDEIIEFIKNKYTYHNKNEILELFVCNDEIERQNYLAILELSKETYQNEQEEKIKKENELNRRKELFSLINKKLISLSKYDTNILELKKNIQNNIDNYTNGINNFILLNNKDKNKFINFIDSIRIDNIVKNEIIKLIN